MTLDIVTSIRIDSILHELQYHAERKDEIVAILMRPDFFADLHKGFVEAGYFMYMENSFDAPKSILGVPVIIYPINHPWDLLRKVEWDNWKKVVDVPNDNR